MTGLDGDVLADYERIVGAVRAEMRVRGLSAVAVAARVGVHPSTVTKWLHGRLTPSVEHLLELAAVVGLRVVVEAPSAVVGSSVEARPSQVGAAGEIARLARRLRARREVCRRTQESVAESLHVTEATVQRWESGRRIPETVALLRWARTLNLSVRVCAGGWEVAGRRVAAGPRPGSTAARRARAGIHY